jgi:arginine decarboxylase
MLVVQVTDVEKHNDDVPRSTTSRQPETVQWLVDLLGPTDIEMVTETYWRATTT